MRQNKNSADGTKNRYALGIWYFVVLCTCINLVALAVFYYMENKMIQVEKNELENHEANIANIGMSLLGKELDFVISDLDFLYENYKNDLNDQNSIDAVSEQWRILSDSRKIYDQIRFIGKDGDEIIRINNSNDGAYVVQSDKLQNKKDRYYFYETIDLNDGQIYVSKLDLNIENGEIESPRKPVIRFSTPVYNDEEQLLGVIVFNYLAEAVLKEFKDIAQVSRGNLFLLDSNGYWLSSDKQNQEFAFMYNDLEEVNFKNDFPQEWELIDDSQGMFTTSKGFVAYSNIVLQDKFKINQKLFEQSNIILGEGSWIVVSYNDINGPNGYLIAASVMDKVKEIISKYLLYFIAIIILSAAAAFFTILNKISKERIKYYSEYDSLTNVFNRRAGLEKIRKKLPENSRRESGFLICFLDINGLKTVNDKLGHKVGDELIVTTVDVIKEAIREEDYVIRMGGDEFLIVLCNSNIEIAQDIWDRIVAIFDQINENEDRPYIISVSHGAVELDKWKDRDIEELIKIADDRMYEEKTRIKANLRVLKKQDQDSDI